MSEVPRYAHPRSEVFRGSGRIYAKLFEHSLCSPQTALPTETKVESGTSQSKSGTSVDLDNSGLSPLRSAPFLELIVNKWVGKCYGTVILTVPRNRLENPSQGPAWTLLDGQC